MASTTLLGWLADIVGTHVFVNGVPKALRRRWNFLGGVTVTDNPTDQTLEVTINGGSNLVGAPDVTITGRDIIAGATRDVLVAATEDVDIDAELEVRIGVDDANAVKIGHVGIITDVLGTLYNNGAPLASSFDPQATPTQNITTTGAAGTTNIGTRAGESVNVGPTSGADTNIRGLVSLDGTGNDVVAQATSWETAAATIYQRASAGDGLTLAASSSIPTAAGIGNASIIADGVASIVGDETTLTGQSGIYVSAAATPPTNQTGKVKLKADTAIELTTAAYTATCSGAAAFSSTSYALTTTAGATLNVEPIRLCYRVRVISTANIASLSAVTVIDGVTLADGDLVLLKDQSTPTQNGLYRFTLSTTTLARATAFDSLAEYHLGTQARAYAGTANKGKAYQLTALSSSLPATWEDITGSGGGSASLDPAGTLELAKTTSTAVTVGASAHRPDVTVFSDDLLLDTTGQVSITGNNGDEIAVYAAGGIALAATGNLDIDSGNDINIGVVAAATEIGGAVGSAGHIQVAGDQVNSSVSAAGSINHRVGSSNQTHTISGAYRRVVTEDAAGSTACTDDYDNAACSHTYVGTLAVGSGGTTVNDIVRLRCGASGGDLISANNANYVYVTNSQVYFYSGNTQRCQMNATGIGFFAAAPVAQPSALTAAVGGTINSGDATTDTEIANMRTRIAELETKLQSLGLLA